MKSFINCFDIHLLLDSYQIPRQIFSSDHIGDPLLNPDVLVIRERQEAILKGLSKLRQVSKNLITEHECIYIYTEVKNMTSLSLIQFPSLH